ncbi:MAG: hypothetical protein QW251_03975 [Desulfurococcaceae archaeon]
MSTELEKYLYYPEMSPRRLISAKYIKVLSILLVFIGLVGVYTATQQAPAPLYRTRDLVGNFFLNYATVMIEGMVVEPVRLDVQTGNRIRLTIYIVDEETPDATPFTVFVYDPVATELLESYNYFDFGDRVRLLVQVRVREEFTYGILQDVKHVVVLERATESTPLNVSSLAGIEQFRYVCAQGIIVNPRNVSAGLLFDLRTPVDSVTVLVPRTFVYRYGNRAEFAEKWRGLNNPGSFMRVCGPVYYYRGTSPEILVLRLEDVDYARLPEAVEVGFEELSNYINESVVVRGFFAGLGYDSTERQYIVTLFDDKGNSVRAYAPREMVSTVLNPWTVGLNSILRITGVVASSVRINATLIEVLEAKPPVNATRVVDALAQPWGSIVVLWGARVDSSFVTSGGSWIIDVKDETGSLRVFVPSSVARGIGQSPPSPGSTIAVAGYRDIYGEYEEIVVYSENGLIYVSVEQPPVGEQPPAPAVVKIGELANYIGQNVVVMGELLYIRYNSTDRLYYVEIADETGRVNVTMSRTLVATIDPWNAGPGTIIRVNGTVRSSNLISASSITVEASKPTPVLTVSEALRRPYGSLVAIVNARVVSSRATSGNDWQINITDESGAIILVFIPRSVVAEIGLSLPGEGAIISVAGYRDVYGGIEEIVVYSKEGYRQ